MIKLKTIMFHVREIIADLNFNDLIRNYKIPLLMDFVKSEPKRFPLWVYKDKSFALFGMTMDYWVRRMFYSNLTEVNFDLGLDSLAHSEDVNIIQDLIRYTDRSVPWTHTIYEGARLAANRMGGQPYAKTDIDKYIPTLQNINKDLCEMWRIYPALGNKMMYNTEYNLPDKGITAHPDIVTETAVLDIKTTGDFAKIAKESFLQILSYFAILRHMGKSVKYIGFILPLQRKFLLYNIDGWDHQPFLQVLEDQAKRLNDLKKGNVSLEEILSIQSKVGTHIGTSIYTETGKSKKITLSEALSQYVQNSLSKGRSVSCQMFLRPNRSGHSSSITADEIINMKEIISTFQVLFFTHAPYIINLSSTVTSKDPNNPAWVRNLLKSDLTITSEIGGRGVVVHTGTCTVLDTVIAEEEALNNMEAAIRDVLSEATEFCPLLLETPCGEGREVITTPEDFMLFYSRFSEDERKRLKICVDTAHVYSAGYYPMDYIRRWVSKYPNSIALIHFNDSAKPFNSHVDRHAPISKGYIGFQELYEVAKWAMQHDIPLIIE